MEGKISVIIPVFNGERYLAEAIESALAQNYSNKEIIVINDGSTDQTAHIAKQFLPHILYHEQINHGLGASRNKGITLSSGQYLAFLDSDDLWEPTKLSEQMRHLGQDALVFTQVKQFLCPSLSEHDKQKIKLNSTELPGYIASSLLLSRKRFNEIGFFTEDKEVGEFIEWYGRVIQHNIPVTLVEKPLLYRRIHLNNMGRQHDLYSRQHYLSILKKNLDKRRQS